MTSSAPVKKAIIFYPHIGEYGGVERNILALATEVIRNGKLPVVVCFYDHINLTKYLPGLKVVEINDHWNPFTKSLRIKRWLRVNKNEILGHPFFFGGKAGFYGAIFNNNYVLHYTDPPSLLSDQPKTVGVKNMAGLIRGRLSYMISRNGVQRAEACITMTNWNAKELEALYGRSFDVIYQGGLPPMGDINQSRRLENSILRIFSISRLTGSKNLDWILPVALRLKNSVGAFNRIEVIIAGTGPLLEELRQSTEKMGLSDSITFPGFLSDQQVEDVYNNSDLFLVPARQWFVLPVLEALYRNVPVVINRESRISEILADNPWVAISDNNAEDFTNVVAEHIIRLRKSYPDSSKLNNLPTERGWAYEIGQKCAWW